MIPKFRAWADGEMAKVELLGEVVVKIRGREWDNLEDVVLMQSTGLHDKNGVEIFEGDIVHSTYGITGAVEYHQGSYYICQRGGQSALAGMSKLGCVFEVIGNIHEHPHPIPQDRKTNDHSDKE